MKKRDYYIKCLKEGNYKYMQWVLEAFTIVRNGTGKLEPFIEREGNNPPFAWITNAEGVREKLIIEDAKAGERLFDHQDILILEPGDLPNVKERVETTYGVALINAIVLCYAFGDKIPYLNDDPITGEKLDSLVASKLTDYPPEGKEKEKDKIYVEELLKYFEGCSALGGYGAVFSPTASPKTMTISPAIIKRRDELFALNKDKLTDPVVLANIDKELTTMLREELKNDSSAAFFISDKAINIAMKKAMISYGLETGFDPDNPSFIPTSLAEGLDFNNMVAIADSSRAGSYSRGAMTALAGQSVKDLYRVFQNTKIVKEDCGAKLGIEFPVTNETKSQFIGRYYFAGNTIKLITDENVKELVGQIILLRSPRRCLAQAPYFCARCVGDRSALNPTGIHVEISDIGSAFMYAEMRAMHGKSLSTKKFSLSDAIA